MIIRTAVAVIGLLALPSSAQGLVQIVLSGAIAQEGGARVEVDLRYEARAGNAVGEGGVQLGLHLANHTTAAELGLLLARELERTGALVIAPRELGSDPKRASIFVDRVHFAALRLGRGLSGDVCSTEEAPALVRILPPKEAKEEASFLLSASHEHPHTKDRGRFELAVQFAAGLSGEQASDLVTTSALNKGWPGQWVDHRAWRPQALATGARVTGACVALRTKGDWRIEVELERDTAR